MGLRSFLTLGLLAAGFGAVPGVAQAASCVVNPGRQQLSAVTSFLADPKGSLAPFPNGGGAMVSFVRNLVITDPAVVKPLLALYPSLSAEQKAAIGAGVGIAAGVCTARTPDATLDIQQAIVLANDSGLTAAFAGVIGDVSTTSIGGTGSGSAGSGSGSGGGGGALGSGSASTGGNGSSTVPNARRTSTGSFDTIASGGGGGTTRTRTTTVFVVLTPTVTPADVTRPGASFSPTLP